MSGPTDRTESVVARFVSKESVTRFAGDWQQLTVEHCGGLAMRRSEGAPHWRVQEACRQSRYYGFRVARRNGIVLPQHIMAGTGSFADGNAYLGFQSVEPFVRNRLGHHLLVKMKTAGDLHNRLWARSK